MRGKIEGSFASLQDDGLKQARARARAKAKARARARAKAGRAGFRGAGELG